MIIENFAELSIEEQINFVKVLLEKINSENIFSEEANFEFTDVEADDITGGLWVTASISNPISVSRKATWSAADEDTAAEDPGRDAEYRNTISEDAEKAFNTLVTQIDGYRVSLRIDDVEEDEAIDAEVEVESISHEDSGIGDYEFWGFKGHDSNPYVEVEGTIIRECDCSLTFFIEPAAEEV